MKKILLFISLTLLCHHAFGKEVGNNFLYTNGSGESEKDALADAKQRLISSIISDVSVTTKSFSQKIDGDITSSFSQEAIVATDAVLTPEFEEKEKNCNDNFCSIDYRVSKPLWTKILTAEINSFLQLSTGVTTETDISWATHFRISDALMQLKRAQRHYLVLLSISPAKAADIEPNLNLASSQLNQHLGKAKVKVTTDRHPFSEQLAASVVDKRLLDFNSPLVIFVSTKTKDGKKGNAFASKVETELQLLDSNNAYAGSQKKKLSKVALSSASKEQARKSAEQELLKQLEGQGLSGIF